MPKYNVKVQQVWRGTIQVEANDKAAAIDAVEAMNPDEVADACENMELEVGDAELDDSEQQ